LPGLGSGVGLLAGGETGNFFDAALLVGGFKHVSFSIIYGIILPID
jgi:hypothetical protein